MLVIAENATTSDPGEPRDFKVKLCRSCKEAMAAPRYREEPEVVVDEVMPMKRLETV